MSGPLSVRGAKATLVISLVMSVLGISGVANGVAWLRATPGQGVAQPDVPPEGAEAADELAEMLIVSPVFKAAAVANILASALMIVASFLLTARRSTALWWAQQAVVANVVYTLGSVGGSIWFLQVNSAAVASIIERLAAAQAQMQNQPPPPSGGPSILALASVLSCFGALTLTVYVLLLRGVRRDDVREFVTKESAS